MQGTIVFARRSGALGKNRRLLAAGVAAFAVAALPAPPVSAHPHLFIDGGVDFVMDESGDLAALRVTWIYDPLASLFMLEDLGITSLDDADLTAEQRAALTAFQTTWDPDFDGDSYLWRDATRIGLSGPLEASARIADGRVVFEFLREVATPFRPGPGTTVRVYDPSYYTSYAVTEAARIDGPPDGCRTAIEPFAPTPLLARLQESLAAIPIDGAPEDPEIGARFAEKVHITCD